jgi:hypothetical protein
MVGPIAELAKWIASLSGVHAGIQALGALWLFRRGTAGLVAATAAATNGLAAALSRVGREQEALRVQGMIPGRGGVPISPAMAPAPAARRATSATSKLPVAVGGGVAARAGAGAATAASEAGRMSRIVGGLGKAAGAASYALLGVSAPVAGLGIAAVGAGFAIKGMIDASNAREAQEKRVRDRFGTDAVPKERPAQGVGRLGAFGATPKQAAGLRAPQDRAAELAQLDKLTVAYNDVNKAMTESARIQSGLVGTGSQLQNSHLMVESAEKAYADAVKQSGKNSLEARMALQQLRDARTADQQARRQWGDGASNGYTRCQACCEVRRRRRLTRPGHGR